MFSRASADHTWPIRPHSRPGPQAIHMGDARTGQNMLEKNSDREVHVEKIDQRPMGSIGFGLERIGLIAVQKPVLSCIILVGLIIGALFWIHRIKIDDSLSKFFRSNSKAYKQYEAETKRFPPVVFDVLVVVEGNTLLKHENLDNLR